MFVISNIIWYFVHQQTFFVVQKNMGIKPDFFCSLEKMLFDGNVVDSGSVQGMHH
jgi:hypothetical protein